MRALVLCGLLVSAASPAFAGAEPSLNGVWEGSYSCKTETASGKDSFKVDATLVIAQGSVTTPFNAVIDAVGFSGTTIPSSADLSVGAGALISCGTSDATTAGLLNRIETFHYQVDPTGPGGTLKTSGAFVQNGSAVGTCKGTWKRVSNGPVKVGACPP